MFQPLLDLIERFIVVMERIADALELCAKNDYYKSDIALREKELKAAKAKEEEARRQAILNELAALKIPYAAEMSTDQLQKRLDECREKAEAKLKAEAEEEPKVEPKAEPKVEPKAEPKKKAAAKPKAEPKVEPKAEPKVEPKAEPKKKAAAKPKAKPEPKVEPKAEPKVEPKAEPKVEPKAETKETAAVSDEELRSFCVAVCQEKGDAWLVDFFNKYAKTNSMKYTRISQLQGAERKAFMDAASAAP